MEYLSSDVLTKGKEKAFETGFFCWLNSNSIIITIKLSSQFDELYCIFFCVHFLLLRVYQPHECHDYTCGLRLSLSPCLSSFVPIVFHIYLLFFINIHLMCNYISSSPAFACRTDETGNGKSFNITKDQREIHVHGESRATFTVKTNLVVHCLI